MENTITFGTQMKRNYNNTQNWKPKHEFNDDHKKMTFDNEFEPKYGTIFISQPMAGARRKIYKDVKQQTYYTDNFDEDEPLNYLTPIFTRFS